MPNNRKLIVFRIVARSCNYLLRIILCYLKSYYYEQTNDYNAEEIITWNCIIISIR